MYFVSVKYSGLEALTKAPENDACSTAEKLYVPLLSVRTEAANPLPLSKATVAPETGTPATLTRPDRRFCGATLGAEGMGVTGLELLDEQLYAVISRTAETHLMCFIARSLTRLRRGRKPELRKRKEADRQVRLLTVVSS